MPSARKTVREGVTFSVLSAGSSCVLLHPVVTPQLHPLPSLLFHSSRTLLAIWMLISRFKHLLTPSSAFRSLRQQLHHRSVYTGYFNNSRRGMSGYSADYVNQKLQKQLQTTHLDVVDVSDGCGAKFECVIVSPLFDGKPILERHRLVNDVLAEEMKAIHAFSMRTLTPEQWSKLQSKG